MTNHLALLGERIIVPGTEKIRPRAGTRTKKIRPRTGRGRNRVFEILKSRPWDGKSRPWDGKKSSQDGTRTESDFRRFGKSSLGRLFSVLGRDEDGIGFSVLSKSRPRDDFFRPRTGRGRNGVGKKSS